MPNRKTARQTPVLSVNYLSYAEETPIGRFWHTIRIDTPDWSLWLQGGTTFSYENLFTCRREKIKNGYFWYAYKKDAANGGRLEKAYIGKDDAVTAENLLKLRWRFMYGKDSAIYARMIRD